MPTLRALPPDCLWSASPTTRSGKPLVGMGAGQALTHGGLPVEESVVLVATFGTTDDYT
jgi:hypothetical protein